MKELKLRKQSHLIKNTSISLQLFAMRLSQLNFLLYGPD